MKPVGDRPMRHQTEPPEHAGGGGTMSLLAVGPVVVIGVALVFLVGSVVADEPAVLEPGRLLATWAAR
jgi:hypothetical protein